MALNQKVEKTDSHRTPIETQMTFCSLLCPRVFSKDAEGCIHPDEIKFVLRHLPSQLDTEEIQEMIDIVDKNNDGKINYSEFRVQYLHLKYF